MRCLLRFLFGAFEVLLFSLSLFWRHLFFSFSCLFFSLPSALSRIFEINTLFGVTCCVAYPNAHGVSASLSIRLCSSRDAAAVQCHGTGIHRDTLETRRDHGTERLWAGSDDDQLGKGKCHRGNGEWRLDYQRTHCRYSEKSVWRSWKRTAEVGHHRVCTLRMETQTKSSCSCVSSACIRLWSQKYQLMTVLDQSTEPVEMKSLSFESPIISMTSYEDDHRGLITYALLENNTVCCGERSLDLEEKSIKIDIDCSGDYLLLLMGNGEIRMVDTET